MGSMNGSQQTGVLYSAEEQAQDFARENARFAALNNAQAGGPVLVADSGQIMTDVGSPYGDVNFGEPVKPNATSNAVFNALVDGIQNPRPTVGQRVTLDDFGNPVIEPPDGDPRQIMDPNRSGAYVMEKVRGRWTAISATNTVETDKAAINGMLNSPGYAAWLMGQHVEAELGNVDKFTLFYNPTEGALRDGWESFKDKMGFTTDIAKQFSEVLQKTQASGRHVDWVAHSQGGIIYSEAVRVSGTDLSNNSVAFHAGGNNQWVTNSIMEEAGVRVIGYRDHPFDPVPNIAGFNTINPVKIIGSVLSFPAIIWGGPELSPHTLPYVKKSE